MFTDALAPGLAPTPARSWLLTPLLVPCTAARSDYWHVGSGAGRPPSRGTTLTTAREDVDDAEAPVGRRRAGLLGLVAVVVLVADVVSKVLVVAELEGKREISLLGGHLLIRASRNPGAAFSFATGATIVFTAVAAVVIVFILRTARRLYSSLWALSLGLLLGGATGNLIDRLLRTPSFGRGAVVDFIDFKVYPSFNIADSAICCGGVLAVLLSLRGLDVDGKRKDDG